jgi:hypothetical protein
MKGPIHPRSQNNHARAQTTRGTLFCFGSTTVDQTCLSSLLSAHADKKVDKRIISLSFFPFYGKHNT